MHLPKSFEVAQTKDLVCVVQFVAYCLLFCGMFVHLVSFFTCHKMVLALFEIMGFNYSLIFSFLKENVLRLLIAA